MPPGRPSTILRALIQRVGPVVLVAGLAEDGQGLPVVGGGFVGPAEAGPLQALMTPSWYVLSPSPIRAVRASGPDDAGPRQRTPARAISSATL